MADPTHIADIDEHQVHTGETLASVAAANGMTEAQLAQFNWGVTDKAAINRHLQEDVGCTRRDAQGNFIFDDHDDPGVIFVPKKFTRGGLATDQTHVIEVRKLSTDKNLHECICVPGLTFAFDKSFIRPSVVEHMHKLDAALQRFPDAKLIVFGHTDRVGSEQYNKELSERRAKSAYAFVTDQPDIWEELFQQENWGTAVIQDILRDLGHDPGPSDGVAGDQTQAAIKDFQAEHPPLAVDGVAGKATRRELFLAYMTGKHDVKVTDAQFVAPKFMGCGEFNPAVEPNAAELANKAPGNEPNRRVIFYLFKRAPKSIPCKLKVLGPCKTEINKPGPRNNVLHTCAFYDGISRQCHCEERVEEFSIRLFDWLGNALPAAPCEVTLAGKPAQRLTADDKGEITLRDVAPGLCKVRWSRPDSMRQKDSGSASNSGDTDFIDREGNQQKITFGEPEKPEFEFEGEVHVKLPEVEEPALLDQDAARKRLKNMGYAMAEILRDNIRAFQRDLGDPQSGELDDAEDKLKERHDEKCQPPGNSSKR
ncbi:MAG TPA: peptidoglycan-binding protein [Phycisphaerae bacterium]|jgi:outer membrane protein OmpA-like peptidoglycan-associated protein